MSTRQNLTSEPTIELQIGAIQLSKRERDAALQDARMGEFFADAILWVFRKSERRNASVFAKPSLRY